MSSAVRRCRASSRQRRSARPYQHAPPRLVLLSSGGVLVGVGMVNWGFAGAVLGCWLLEGRRLERAAIIYCVYVLMMIVLFLPAGTDAQRAGAVLTLLSLGWTWGVGARRRTSRSTAPIPDRRPAGAAL